MTGQRNVAGSSAEDTLQRLVLDAIPLQIAVLDPQGEIIEVNAAWRRFGAENGVVSGHPVFRTGIGVNYLEICERAYGAAFNDGCEAAAGIRDVLAGRRDSFVLEYPCHAPDRQRWFTMTVTPLAQGQGAVVAHADITTRKLGEMRLKTALDATGDGLWEWDLTTGMAYLSPGYYALTGYRSEDVPADFDFCRRMVHPDDWPNVLDDMERHLRGESQRSEIEYRMITASGAIRWIRGRGRVVQRDEAGTALRMTGLITDITESKRIEQVLKESEERYRAVVEDQTEIICRVRLDGTFVFVNDVYCRFFGKRAEELLGNTWMPVCHPDDLPRVLASLEKLTAENPVVVIENRVYSGDGREHWMQFVNRGFFDGGGRLLEIQSVGRDISDRMQAEAALMGVLDQLEQRVVERTDEVRRLAVEATLAEERERQAIACDLHDDLGQRLHVVRLRLDTLARRCPDSAEAVMELRDLVSEASQIVRSLTSQLSSPVLKKLGMVPALAWLAEEMARQYGLSVDFRHDDGRVGLSPAQSAILFRSARELLINVAKHAGTTSARMTLEQTDTMLTLTVEDGGVGMAGADAGRSKDGAFGLASVRERVTFLGGGLDIGVPSGGGSRVTLSLPVREEK